MNERDPAKSPVAGRPPSSTSDIIVAVGAFILCVLTAGFGGLAAATYCALHLRGASARRGRASIVVLSVSLALCLLFSIAAALWFLTDNVGGGGPVGTRWSEVGPFVGVNLTGGAIVIGVYWWYQVRTSK